MEELADMMMPRPTKAAPDFLKILCHNDQKGRSCQRWLARVQDGVLYIRCPRCKQDEAIDLAVFIRLYRDWLVEITDEMRDTAFQLDFE